MNCPQCQVELMDAATFCHKCGASVADVEDEFSGQPEHEAADRQEPPPFGEPVDQPPTLARTANERFREAVAARQQVDDDDDEERELWDGRYSGKAMFGTWIIAGIVSLLVVIGAAFMSLSGFWWAILIGGIVLAWIGLYLLLLYRKYSLHYRLTNQRLIDERGLLSRTINRIEVIDVDDVTFSQGPIERIFGVGKIMITSSDRTDPEMSLRGIEDVRNVATIIDDCRRKERRKRGLHIEAV